jgi:hypothetical protein
MAHDHAHAHSDTGGHRTSDDEYRETPPGAGYEHTDANSWIIAKFLVWLVVAAVIIHFGLALLFNLFVEQRVERADPRYPLAAQEGERRSPEQEVERIPEPRLQRFPREDFMNFRLSEEGKLQRYGWVDKDAGTVHIPIHDAMRLMLERKMLDSRPQEPAAGTPAPSGMPSDASAGRTMERRRQ